MYNFELIINGVNLNPFMLQRFWADQKTLFHALVLLCKNLHLLLKSKKVGA